MRIAHSEVTIEMDDSVGIADARAPVKSVVEVFEEWVEPRFRNKHAWQFPAKKLIFWKESELSDELTNEKYYER